VALRVVVEDLVTSGVTVTGHGEAVAVKHSAADARIEAAAGGWLGLSAAAMLTRSGEWAATTTALVARLGDHAQGLHTSAHCFFEMDSDNGQSLAAPGQGADSIAASTGT
jgi:hypothetical protein